MNPLISYWELFRVNFKKQLENSNDGTFSNAWKSSAERTRWYKDTVLKNIATEMGLEYLKENFKIDYTFCKKSKTGDLVPLIFVESENVAVDSDHEMRKLCCLCSPLKILITCAEWTQEPGVWKHSGHREKLTNMWSKRIKSHYEVWPQATITGIIVAEWSDKLRYYTLSFDSAGNLIEDNKLLFQLISS